MRLIFTFFLLSLFACNEESSIVIFSEDLPTDVTELENLLLVSGDPIQKLEVRYNLYKSYREHSKGNALNHLSKMVEESLESQNHYYLGKAFFGQGYIFEGTGEYVAAVEAYLKAIDSFGRIQRDDLVASSLNNLGLIFMETGNYDYAKRFFQRTKDIHKQFDDFKRLVLVHLNLGICNFSGINPDFSSALAHLENARDYVSLLDDNRDYFHNRICNNLGAMFYKQKNFKMAREYYLKSLEHIESDVDSERVKFIAYSNIAEAAIGIGNLSEATIWIEKTSDLLNSASIETKAKISGCNIIATFHQQTGNDKIAVDLLERAIYMADKTIINEPLQESLRLLRSSYGHSQLDVSKQAYDNLLELDNQQDHLERELVDKLNFEVLQAALGKTIELDQAQRNLISELAAKERISKLALVLVSCFS